MEAISLFSGCGGDTLGLERAGFKVTGFNEFKSFAVNSHLANFPESVLIKDGNNTDITKIPDSAFTPYKGRVQIVFAGFPCQGFSSAGKKKSNDPRNQMFRQFLRVAKAVRPQFIIGENVTGIQTMKSGPNETDPLVLDIIIKEFHDAGYQIYHKLVEATDFGVPQKRKRVILVGWNTWANQAKRIEPESFWAAVSGFGQKLPSTIMRSFVTKSMEGAYPIPEAHVPDDFSDYALSISEDAEPTGTPHPYIVLKVNQGLLSCSKRVSPIHSEIVDLNRPCKTIICTYDHQPRLLVGLRKPSGACYCRCLLPDELKQVQGFPADFILSGSKKDQVTQIGNAVPPAIIQSVASCLKDILNS
jgi:DNA (cytosine-5)-methyltransferase 1